MVGYDSNSTNYRLLDMETKKITVSRHDFNEEATEVGKPKRNWPIINIPVSNMEDNNKDETEIINEEDIIDEEIKKPEKSQSTGVKLCDRSKIRRRHRYEANRIELDESQSIEKALAGPETERWQTAIDEEMAVMEKNGT